MLYGKWRPRGFDEVVGQEHIVTTLRNALATGQVAHAYLFSGPRGTGKTTTARILARAVNCANLKAGEPCNACSACEAILKGSALDLIEMDAASNRGIDDVRELRDKIAFAPSDLQKKVYLLDEVHMLTAGAFNALLKTLEEPPPHAFFILATTELHQVPATIKSRCQRYDFRRVGNDAMLGRLKFICEQEGFSVPDEGLLQIAIQARGGMRDAITLLEQVVARYGESPSTDDVLAALGLVHDERSELLARAIVEEDLAAALDLARQVAEDGLDIARFTRETLDILRDVLPQVIRREAREGPAAGLAKLALDRGTRVASLATAVDQLAKADFRLDPASPIPLEVACAAAILGPAPVEVVQVASQAARVAQQAAPGQRPGRPASPSGQGESAAALSPSERFIKQLYDNCRTVNVKVGAWLNGSCEVLSMEGDELELGFYHEMHMQKVSNDFRALVEEQATILLKRPVRLKVRQIERSTQAKRAPRAGHLVEAARAIGGVPVGKDE